MKRQKLWLRIAFGYGAIADAITAVQMLFPGSLRLHMPVDIEVNEGFVFGMRFGAPVMIGWTALLLWAALKPLERKDIALLTVVPVMVCYTAIFLWAIFGDLAPLGKVIPLFVSQAVLYGLLGFSYLNTRRTEGQ